MAEFCLNCWNKMNESEDSKKKYILSKELDLCDGCGEWRPVIIMERKAYYTHKFRYFILPVRIIYSVSCFIWSLLLLSYCLFKDYKPENKDQL